MDKNKIKKFAIEARRELISDITQKLAAVGIDEHGIADEMPNSTEQVKYYTNISEYGLSGDEIKWRKDIKSLLESQTDEDNPFNEVLDNFIEEVAYTWFNRIIAIRFMEVNDYLPSRVRVLSSEEGRVEPDIIRHALEIEDDLGEYSDKQKQLIVEALDKQTPELMDKVYGMLFIKQADALQEILPGLFERTADYLKLLFTPQYNRGIIRNLIEQIPSSDFDVNYEDEEGHAQGQVQIIGWLYQFYNTELHDDAINIKGKKSVKKSEIPAATQLFTPDWIVRYMVDNSLGKFYLEHNSDSNLTFKYLLPSELVHKSDDLDLEQYRIIDNAMGSGHILVYAFDCLLKMYEEQGYTKRDAVTKIIENNLFGLEIDKRAYQLSYFAIMMKARQYDRRFLKRNINLNLYQFKDVSISDHLISKLDDDTGQKLKELMGYFKNAQEYGSIIKLPKIEQDEIDSLKEKVSEIQISGLDIDNIEFQKDRVLNALNVLSVMTQKYNAVITNPPYLNKFDSAFKKYLKANYSDYSKDLFSVFMVNNLQMLAKDGYAGFMTPLVWMFIKTYEPLRIKLIQSAKIDSLIQMEYSAFEEATVPINTFVLKNGDQDSQGTYVRLSDFKGGMKIQKDKTLKAIENPNVDYLYKSYQSNFNSIPGSPIAYWASENLINDFKNGTPLGDIADAKQGLATADNNRFLRQWYEVSLSDIFFNAHNSQEALESNKKWFPYNKGGAYRKWYGNYDYVVNWENDGYEIKHFTDSKGKQRSVVRNPGYYFKEAVTWSKVSSGIISFRKRKLGSIFADAGMSLFSKNDVNINLLLGFINSKVVQYVSKLLFPTLNFEVGQVSAIPVLKNIKQDVEVNVNNNIALAKKDWDRDETSWDFNHHFLINGDPTIQSNFTNWLSDLKSDFSQMKQNEEELNRYFIDLYKLQDELTPDVPDKQISIRNPEANDNQLYAIKSLLSYFIGCVFGRYSLSQAGLAYAGGEWDDSKYGDFKPNKENIILLTDTDYFGNEKDIINRLKEFLSVAFSSDTISDNMHYIAETLDPKGIERGKTSEEVIRTYFIKDFFKDHLKQYRKRPIYWEFNSGKQNGFKALMYLHRYHKDELAMARNYLFELQDAYANAQKLFEDQMENAASASTKQSNRKQAETVKKQLAELIKYDTSLQHQSLAQIELDLDDGVLANYAKLQGDEKLLTKFK